MTHLRAVPDEPPEEPVEPVESLAPEGEDDAPVDGAAAVAPEEEPEAASEGEEPDQPVVEERRIPSTIGGAFFLSILAVATGGLVIAVRSDWRLGVQVLAGALMVAALLRLLLANRDAGMLAVRNRALDAILMGGAGIVLMVLAGTIPNMPAL